MTARSSGYFVVFVFGVLLAAYGQEAPSAQDEHEVIKRFELVLARNPRAGIALDKVYEYHIQLGDLDQFLAQLEKRSKAEPQNSAKLSAAIGLLENQRGRDQRAIEWPIGKFDIEPNQQSYPGLYVPAGVEKFSVRNMTLQGNWPSALPKNLWEQN